MAMLTHDLFEIRFGSSSSTIRPKRLVYLHLSCLLCTEVSISVRNFKRVSAYVIHALSQFQSLLHKATEEELSVRE